MFKNIFKVAEDFKIGYPDTIQLFEDWNVLIKTWSYFTRILISLRRGSIEDKHARSLFVQLETSDINGSKSIFLLKILVFCIYFNLLLIIKYYI